MNAPEPHQTVEQNQNLPDKNPSRTRIFLKSRNFLWITYKL